jgi:hypothetical protein
MGIFDKLKKARRAHVARKASEKVQRVVEREVYQQEYSSARVQAVRERARRDARRHVETASLGVGGALSKAKTFMGKAQAYSHRVNRNMANNPLLVDQDERRRKRRR